MASIAHQMQMFETCTECEGRGSHTSSYAPNPAQPNILRPDEQICTECNGMGAKIILE